MVTRKISSVSGWVPKEWTRVQNISNESEMGIAALLHTKRIQHNETQYYFSWWKQKRATRTLNRLWYYLDITRMDENLRKINTTSHLKINVYSFSHILFIWSTMVNFIHLLGTNRRLIVHQCYITFSVIVYNVKKAKCYLVISSITMFYRKIFPS